MNVVIMCLIVGLIIALVLGRSEPPKELPPPGPIEEFSENLLETASNLRGGLSSIGKSFSDESIDTLVSIGNFADLAILEFFNGTLYTLTLIREIIATIPRAGVVFAGNIGGLVAQMGAQVGAVDITKMMAWVEIFLGELNQIITDSVPFLAIGFETGLRIVVMLVRGGISLLNMVLLSSKEAISGLMETTPGVAGLGLESLGTFTKALIDMWKALSEGWKRTPPIPGGAVSGGAEFAKALSGRWKRTHPI